jgi:threonine synthase
LRALFAAHSIDEHGTEMTIRNLYAETGVVIDPHTAVGLAAAQQESVGTPMIVLSTAHPAKFPQAIERAIGRLPEQPERLKAKLGQEERVTVLPNDVKAVASFIADRARARSEVGA